MALTETSKRIISGEMTTAQLSVDTNYGYPQRWTLTIDDGDNLKIAIELNYEQIEGLHRQLGYYIEKGD